MAKIPVQPYGERPEQTGDADKDASELHFAFGPGPHHQPAGSVAVPESTHTPLPL